MPKRLHLAILVVAAFCLAGSASSAENATKKPKAAKKGETGATSVKDQMLSAFRPITSEEFRGRNEENPLSLHDVVQTVLKNNHNIRIAFHKPDQARAGIMEAKAAYDPEAFADWQHTRNENPKSVALGRRFDSDYRNDTERAGVRQHLPTGGTVSAYREWNQGTERNSGYARQRGHGGAYVLELSQPLLNGFADKENRTIIEISRLQLDISEEEVRLAVLASMADSIEAYWNAALSELEVTIAAETLNMAETLLNRERDRQTKGVSTPLDVHRAREAVATRTNNLLNAREQRQNAQERLKLLLNAPSAPIGTDVRIIVTEDLETPLVKSDVNKSIDAALANRPEMRNADLAIRTGEARRGYAKHNLLPQLTVGGSVRRNDKHSTTPTSTSSTDTQGTDWSLGVSFSMPIGNMKPRAMLRRAESELSQSIDEKQNTQSYIITEVKMAAQTLDLLAGQIPVSVEAVEAARKVVEGEWARLELNQVGNRDLLQAQDLLAVAERSRVQTLARYNVAIARLLETEGTLLDHMGIKVIPPR